MARNPKRSKKAAKQTASGTKGKHRIETGIDNARANFFLGGEDKIAGRMFYKPPRWTSEYEKMKVSDLVQRITDDLEELRARAYPTATAYYRLVKHRLLPEESGHAANALFFVVQWGATYLENLFLKQPELLKEVARKRDLCPVNLGLRWTMAKGKRMPAVRRLGFARKYLTELELNLECDFPSSHESGAEPTSPFRLAAEDLYTKMLLIKRDSRIWFPKLTRWAKRLLALEAPMTKSNAADWWKIAKVYLDERWDKAPGEFEPLIKYLCLTLSKKTPYQSRIKNRVIDNDLKDAFVGLARPDFIGRC